MQLFGWHVGYDVIWQILFLAVLAWWIWRNWDKMERVPRTPERTAEVKARIAARAASRPSDGMGISGCFAILLVLTIAGGVIWAAFAIHPGIGIALVAFALLLIVSNA